jgi:uncharacterized repeat protein (TIGR03837 family)
LWTILTMQPTSLPPRRHWDIFCQVIDNFGDIGVCWRLAVNLAQRSQQVRLWVDDATALTWMAPQGEPGVEVRPWTQPIDTSQLTPGHVLVEAFGCQIAPEFIVKYADDTCARGAKSAWINLEYLSAENYVQRCHGLPSLVMQGPGVGLSKHFFYPGFTPQTGGLLRETDLLTRQSQFDRTAWLALLGIDWQGKRLISLFCYEPAALDVLLDQLAQDAQPTCLLVTAGRAQHAVQRHISNKNRLKRTWNKSLLLSIFYLPTLTHEDFDHLLWACDVNFVRGEDSLVRALWAGKPLVWQIYPQDDGAHGPKLEAFLVWLQAPASMRAFHHAWNATSAIPDEPPPTELPFFAIPMWQKTLLSARERLLQQDDLATSLLSFVSKTN